MNRCRVVRVVRVVCVFVFANLLVGGCSAQDNPDNSLNKPTSSSLSTTARDESGNPNVGATSSGEGGLKKTGSDEKADTSKQDEEKTVLPSQSDTVPTPSSSAGAGNQSETKPPASLVRRPTAPTDAKELADRPPKPKFVRPESNRQKQKYDLTFDDLAFEIGEGEAFRWSMITPELYEYDGATITLRGFIRPSFKQRGLNQFVFVRDNQECCFGPGAALYDCVLVKMAEGKATNFTVRPVTIEGVFYLRKYAGPDGNVWAIFRIKEGQVK